MRRAAHRHGVFTRREALAAGMTSRQIDHRVASGRWKRLSSGVYLTAGAPLTDLARMCWATLATGGAVSHRSAVWMLGLGPRTPQMEVTTELSRGHHLTQLRLHRTDDVRQSHLVRVSGIYCTSAARTCIDMGARVHEEALERLIDRAVHAGITTIEEVVRTFLQLAVRGRDGIATARAVLVDLTPDLAVVESDLETLFVRLLRQAGLPEPERQVAVTVGHRLFRLDFAYSARRIAIECDGFATHGTRAAFEEDRERQNLLILGGWTILRFTWRQIVSRPDEVVAHVRAALNRPKPSGPPTPEVGR